jgi:hypothetical protein
VALCIPVLQQRQRTRVEDEMLCGCAFQPLLLWLHSCILAVQSLPLLLRLFTAACSEGCTTRSPFAMIVCSMPPGWASYAKCALVPLCCVSFCFCSTASARRRMLCGAPPMHACADSGKPWHYQQRNARATFFKHRSGIAKATPAFDGYLQHLSHGACSKLLSSAASAVLRAGMGCGACLLTVLLQHFPFMSAHHHSWRRELCTQDFVCACGSCPGVPFTRAGSALLPSASSHEQP